MFDKISEANLIVRALKFVIYFNTIDFAGYHLSQGINSLNEDNITKIRDASSCRIKKKVWSFLGVTVQKYIPKYVVKVAPLTDQTRKGRLYNIV